jgi:hypothetical protein
MIYPSNKIGREEEKQDVYNHYWVNIKPETSFITA